MKTKPKPKLFSVTMPSYTIVVEAEDEATALILGTIVLGRKIQACEIPITITALTYVTNRNIDPLDR